MFSGINVDFPLNIPESILDLGKIFISISALANINCCIPSILSPFLKLSLAEPILEPGTLNMS